MRFVLDAGAMIALERGDRGVTGVVALARRRGIETVTHGGVVGQVWRGGARQAILAQLLRATEVVPLDEGLGREAGGLLAAADTSDVIDAAVVSLARDGDTILTSDPIDIARLVEASGVLVEVRRV